MVVVMDFVLTNFFGVKSQAYLISITMEYVFLCMNNKKIEWKNIGKKIRDENTSNFGDAENPL